MNLFYFYGEITHIFPFDFCNNEAGKFYEGTRVCVKTQFGNIEFCTIEAGKVENLKTYKVGDIVTGHYHIPQLSGDFNDLAFIKKTREQLTVKVGNMYHYDHTDTRYFVDVYVPLLLGNCVGKTIEKEEFIKMFAASFHLEDDKNRYIYNFVCRYPFDKIEYSFNFQKGAFIVSFFKNGWCSAQYLMG
jgi:hypothetical protein